MFIFHNVRAVKEWKNDLSSIHSLSCNMDCAMLKKQAVPHLKLRISAGVTRWRAEIALRIFPIGGRAAMRT